MARFITNLHIGETITYMGQKYEVDDCYPYIAYLKLKDGTDRRICVNLGDLVMAGIEPIMPITCSPVF